MKQPRKRGFPSSFIAGRIRLAPLAEVLAVTLLASTAVPAYAQTPITSSWIGAFQAGSANRAARAAARPGAQAGLESATIRQQQAARQTPRRPVANLERTAAAIAAQQVAQRAARTQAQGATSGVPNGLVQGGLWDRGANGNLLRWTGAERAVQTVEDGKTAVAIKQTQSKAILNWETFNVGRETTVDFQQGASDAVLNRVVGADTRPSQIQGAIKGDGTVMVVNQNGVIFSGSSQVNTRNLVAAAANITDARFNNGLYNGSNPTFTGAAGQIEVQRGAQIETKAPESSTAGGGYVLLLGKYVENAGTLSAPNGQVALAAGDSFVIRKGYGTAGNQTSSTRGNEAAVSGTGKVVNTGLIQAKTGDVTLTASEVRQNGVALAATSVDARGAVHLNAAGADGKVVLGKDATTAIVLEDTDTTALDGQRDSLQTPVVDTTDDNIVPADPYRRDLSLVAIKSGGSVDFEGGSLTLAVGGQIAVDAGSRALLRDDAVLDVSGAIGVKAAMEDNNLNIWAQGNEQRDAPVNRNGGGLNNTALWIDRRSLVYVAAGANGYKTDRWYTAGGLLEVSGYLNTTGHRVGEWMAQGGTVSFTGGDVVTQAGSSINLSGGTLDARSGYLRQSWLKGSDGRLYEVSSAPGDVLYKGLYQGYERSSERWGHTDYYVTPLIGASSRYEPGYTVGRDAGTLAIGTRNAALEGQILGETFQGDRQTQAAQAGRDGYYQSRRAVARGGTLIVGSYTPYYVKDSGTLRYGLTSTANTLRDVVFSKTAEKIAAGLGLDTAPPEDREGTLYLDTAMIDEARLGGVRIAARDRVAVDDDLSVGNGGEITLYSQTVDVNADVISHGGTIRLGNVLYQVSSHRRFEDTALGSAAAASVTVAPGASVDASGLWSNLRLDPSNIANLPYQDAGSVSIRGSGDVTLSEGGKIDVSSGAAFLADGSFTGGRGGDITLHAGANQAAGGAGSLVLDGSVYGYGVKGGGTLSLQSGGAIVAGNETSLRSDGTLSAGELLAISMALAEDYTVAAGEILPADVTLQSMQTPVVSGGDVLPADIAFHALLEAAGGTLVTPAPWKIPSGLTGNITGLNASGDRQVWRAGSDVPAGATFDTTLGAGNSLLLPAGMALPVGVFTVAGREGLQLPEVEVSTVYKAGAAAPQTVVLDAGTLVPAGSALARDARFEPVLQLPSGYFNRGFSQYDVAGATGLLVSKGSTVDVTMPVYLARTRARDAATGAGREEALELWTRPRYSENPNALALSRRAGASLSLHAGSRFCAAADQAAAQARIDQGASLSVDPGQSIEVRSIGPLTVDGTLRAPSGEILLGAETFSNVLAQRVRGSGNARSIWVGENAVLDVSGAAAVTSDAQGRRYGVVDAGGSIVVGGVFDSGEGAAAAADLFVVVREGAVLDASGASAVLDVPGQGATEAGGAGGSITLASSNGLYLDGTLRAEPGAANAAGGSLTVALNTPIYDDDASRRVRQARELQIREQRSGPALPDGLTPVTADERLAHGQAVMSAEQLASGGFDSLTLASDGVLSFAGDLSLTAGYVLNLYARVIGLAEGSAENSQVHLAAPYVRLQSYGGKLPEDGEVHPTLLGGTLSRQAPAGTLTLQAGRLLDVGGLNLTVGGRGVTTGSGALATAIDRRAFDDVQLISGADLRLTGSFYTPGDLTLAAARIYPATGVSATVYAGYRGTAADFDPERVLTIARTTEDDPAMPYSAFGRLALGAAIIDQGGVARAPLGSIFLGVRDGSVISTDKVNLLPGSLTSVSANGLVMPYGGTSDAESWQYAGEKVDLAGAGSLAAGRVTLTGQYVDVRDGAVVDLSGGGQLTGAGFVSGRSGSTDARYNPLVRAGRDGFTLPGLDTNPVYAIAPGVQAVAAPAGGEAGAVDPLFGQQITLGEGVPGLPAGTYTLLPSTYALLPGAFRVELNGQTIAGALGATATALRNGSWSVTGRLSIAGTRIQGSLARQVMLTSADTLRGYSQYNETSYADFVRADAAALGVPRARIEADAQPLRLAFIHRDQDSKELSFSFDGAVLGEAAEGGYGSTLAVTGAGSSSVAIEILGDEALPSTDYGVALRASDLSQIEVNRLAIGALPRVAYGQGGNIVRFDGNVAGENMTPAAAIVVRNGSRLSAPEILLIGRSSLRSNDGIVIEQGAVISALDQGQAACGTADGFIFQPGSVGVVAVSNGVPRWLAPENSGLAGPSPIRVGMCASGDCSGTTQLYSEGGIAFVTNNDFQLDDAVRYGARHLSLAAGAFNIGSTEALAAASARGTLTPGLALNQPVMERLLQGDTSSGIPALETLALIADESVNFFDTVTLSTLDADGKSLLDNLMLTTPAIYGDGDAEDVALIQTGHLIWNGAAGEAPAVVQRGAGTGAGTLRVQAEQVTFGYGAGGRPDGISELGRQTLGFANVNLQASKRIDANNVGTLKVYQSRGESVTGEGYRYRGGNLNVVTPLWAGEAGSINRITAGGRIMVSAPESGAADASPVSALGAELSLTAGQGVQMDTAVALPSGKLTLAAANGDVLLGDRAYIDVSGRAVAYFDDAAATQYSWGGDVNLSSAAGDVRQSAGSTINLSAGYNQAGTLTAVALNEAAGTVDLLGTILGSASGDYEAGGTYVPYLAGSVNVRAQQLGAGDLPQAFAALNQRLNDAGVLGARSFQIKQGNLTIGDGLRANHIEVSLDGGHLAVAGTVDASGERVGSIRLAAGRGLTVAQGAVLDAHGRLLRVDSYGQIIDSPNRAIVELDAGDGVLTLGNGARIDLRYGTGDARYAAQPELRDRVQERGALGTLDLVAARLDADGQAGTEAAATYGGIAIAASGGVDLQGVKSIAVYGRQVYDDAPYGTDEAASGRPYQVINPAWLDGKHDEAEDFMAAALTNTGLLRTRLAGLHNSAYADVFHLRPAVEVVSATVDGDLVVSGDLDLSGYRYGSLNPTTQKTGVYGSGEPGALAIRAGGDLSIYGSINDGAAPPPDTPDDNGWVLTPGVQGYGGDVVAPGAGVALAEGTVFPAGKTLNYAVPVQAMTLPAGTQLPVAATLAASLTLPAGTVAGAEIRDASGAVLAAAGAVLGEALPLPEGAVLGVGLRLPTQARIGALTWPANVALPVAAALARNVTLAMGALIPSMTGVKLVDDAPLVELRSVSGDRMGRNWAIAEMLPEGSLSWRMRFVAGADTQAADSRLERPASTGRIVLADTHYGLYKVWEPGGIQIWTREEIDYWGVDRYWADYGLSGPVKAGDPVVDPENANGFCDANSGPGACATATHTWAREGVEYWGVDAYWADYGLNGPVKAGDPVFDPTGNGFCDTAGSCVALEGGDLLAAYPVAQNFSVLRTGTGDLDLVAGGDIAMQSLYGIYTAGTSSASRAGEAASAFDRQRAKANDGDGTYLRTSQSADSEAGAAYEALVDGGEASTYAAWYPDGGGNVLLKAGGNFTGDVLAVGASGGSSGDLRQQRGSVDLGNWLWRQGSGETAGVDPIPASWWINFGTYVPGPDPELTNTSTGVPWEDIALVGAVPELAGFTGVGTLGGGNLTVQVGGDAGLLAPRGAAPRQARGQGLILAVGGTGRVRDNGEVLLTGGGDLRVDLGGALNPGLAARASTGSTRSDSLPADYRYQNVGLEGLLSNLRGGVQLEAGALGGLVLSYYRDGFSQVDVREVRPFDPYRASKGTATGGLVLALGDSAATLATRGDLVLSGTGDPGRVALPISTPYTKDGDELQSGGYSWFSLWTENTAIRLFAAGGDLTPSIQLSEVTNSGSAISGLNYSATDGRFVWPGQLSLAAADGSIYLGASALGPGTIASEYNTAYSLLLAPSENGQLEMLAGDSIYAGGYAVSRSAASVSAIPTPLNPAFAVFNTSTQAISSVHNLDEQAIRPSIDRFPLFTFGPNTATTAMGTLSPARFYAAKGDVLGLGTGEVLVFSRGSRAGQTWYEAAGPVWMRAGGDIVRSGALLAETVRVPAEIGQTPSSTRTGIASSSGNLILHTDAADVSIVEAGGDILYSTFNVAGPGALEISAGGNFVMAGQAVSSQLGMTYGESGITSLGPVVPGDSRPGASIAAQAGLGDQGADWRGFLARYSDPPNRAEPDLPLADQEGQVAYTYEGELVDWLAKRYGFEGTVEEARAYVDGLPSEQQRLFARQVYFAELKAGGREYNDPDGSRFGSYLRGRQAIASLFPEQDADGNGITYAGDLLAYGGAGIHTNAGGDIQVLTPGGAQTYGLEGEAPPSTAGVVTLGQGDIQLYSLDSILLGQSRIMTTFGGSILGWSAAGDINAGRGSRTTVVYTPPLRTYDAYGNVTLSPSVPSTGAGIATLNPIPEVEPGDIDLIAPLGAIDAGEAGIRVSGNINFAAPQVVNAANIQVQGESTGISGIAAVNVGALSSASAATQAAQDVMRQQQAADRQNQPSIISVRILGFGDEAL